MTKKYTLQKTTAAFTAGVIILSMGSCEKNIETTIISENPTTTQEQQMTNKNLESTTTSPTTTTFSIFEDPDTIVLSEPITLPKNEESTTMVSEKKEKPYYSRFTNQQQLETYLEQIYNETGKDYWNIIVETELTEDYYANQTDLSASAAYMLLKDNGLSLEDVETELDYLLCLVNNPREEYSEDREALETLYKVTKGHIVYPIFKQLALEIHLIKCPNKHNHQNESGRLICSTLDEEKLYIKLMENKEEKLEVGPALIRKIKQLIEQYS